MYYAVTHRRRPRVPSSFFRARTVSYHTGTAGWWTSDGLTSRPLIRRSGGSETLRRSDSGLVMWDIPPVVRLGLCLQVAVSVLYMHFFDMSFANQYLASFGALESLRQLDLVE